MPRMWPVRLWGRNGKVLSKLLKLVRAAIIGTAYTKISKINSRRPRPTAMSERGPFLDSRLEFIPTPPDTAGPTCYFGSHLLRFHQLRRQSTMISREIWFGQMLRKLIKVLSSFWLVVLFVAVGWGPALVADLIREALPVLDASYGLQDFAMHWMDMTALCSLLAVVAAGLWGIRFFRRRFPAKDMES